MLIPILAFIAGMFLISTVLVIYMAVNAPTLEESENRAAPDRRPAPHHLAGPKDRRKVKKALSREVINRPHLAK